LHASNFNIQYSIDKNMRTKIKNTTDEPKTIYIVTREKVTLEPGEEIEFDGDLELGQQ
jgi:hypothetical protein